MDPKRLRKRTNPPLSPRHSPDLFLYFPSKRIYTGVMAKNREHGTLLIILLGLSYLSAISYIAFLSPTAVNQIYGYVTEGTRMYWLFSGVVFISSLIGLTLWKRMAAYPFIGIILMDAYVAQTKLHSTADVVFNLALATAWFFVLRRNWHKFD